MRLLHPHQAQLGSGVRPGGNSRHLPAARPVVGPLSSTASLQAQASSSSSSSSSSDAHDSSTSEPQRQRQRRQLFGESGRPAATADAAGNAPSQQQQQQLAQAEPRWWERWQRQPAPTGVRAFAFWDVDNLQPLTWTDASRIAKALKASLARFGRLARLAAYANTTTLTQYVGKEGLQEEVEAGELRCELCGRRCKSLADLRTHVQQLHEREHGKKMRAPRKAARRYTESDKAQRVRQLLSMHGSTKRGRSGRTGQMVRVLLQRQGVSVFEVGTQPQAADDKINRHIANTLAELRGDAAATAGEPVERDRLGASVLVIVSDDRGFGRSVAGWLRAGGAGAVLVTRRAPEEWLPVLQRECRVCGCGVQRAGDVAFVPWDDVAACGGGGRGLDEDSDVDDDEGGWLLL